MNLRKWLLSGCMVNPRLGVAVALSYYLGLAVLLICPAIAAVLYRDGF